jgi:type I restriction enzyme S subunit
MSKNNKNKLVPRLRFPEFKNKYSWARRELSEILFEHKEKSTGKEEVFSVSVHKGVINQIEHLGRAFAANNTDNYKRVLPGDIIYTKSPTGDFPFGIIKQSKVSHPVIVSPLYGVFTPETIDLGVILDAYFQYPENTINYLSSIVQKGPKNTINIKNETFLSKSLILPKDKLEQKKIANCLSSLDEVIAGERQKLALLQQHKKGLLQQLFPQEGETVPTLRFKEFVNDGDWKILPLNKLCNEITEKTKGRKFKLMSITSGVGLVSQIEKYGKEIAGNSYKNYYVLKNGDFAYNKSSTKQYPEGEIAMLEKEEDGAVPSSIFICFRFDKSKVEPRFAKYLFVNNIHGRWLKKYIAVGARAHGALQVNSKDLFSIPFPLTSLSEQQKIAACLSSLDDLIAAQTQKIELLEQHKKGLVQGLFPMENG